MYQRLRGKIIEKYGSQKVFSKHVGLSQVSISRKMTGRSEFSQKDIMKWCELLGIPHSDIGYFFYT